MTRPIIFLLTASMLVALAAGCSSSDRESADDAEASAGSATTQPVEALDWGPCDEQGDAYECATLPVPLDYDDPDGEQLEIAVIRHPATDPEARIGSVVYNPGGPGGSGLGAVPFFIDGERIPDELLARFDFVSFDPRGVGASSPIDCHPNVWDTIATDSAPTDQAGVDALLEVNQVMADDCAEREGDVLPYLGTMNVARDMDRLRQAVGDEQLTYLGMSYGTRLGATYAELFPENVRAMVLDGSVEPDADLFSFRAGQAPGFEEALTNWFAWCEQEGPETCPFAPDSEARFDALVEELDAEPAYAPGDDRPVTASVLRTVAGSQLYFSEQFPELAAMLASAEQGDVASVIELADAGAKGPDGEYTNLVEVNAAINCADFPERPSVDEVQAFADEQMAAYPRMGGPQTAWSPLICSVWPTEADPVPNPFTGAGAGPILVLGSTGDPATPFDWSGRMADALEEGVHVVREGPGHTSYGSISACIDATVDRYLIDLEVPEDGVTCPTD